jgi:hypothetical protein
MFRHAAEVLGRRRTPPSIISSADPERQTGEIGAAAPPGITAWPEYMT